MKIQIGENIRRFGVALGITQNELAILLSVSPQAVSRWENGQAFPDITLLPSLARFLDVSIDELMGTEEQKSKSLKKELHERSKATIEDFSMRVENEMRILDIYEELGRTEFLYLICYFQHLMKDKRKDEMKSHIPKDRIINARKMIRERMRTADMKQRTEMLQTICSFEDESKLGDWENEYAFPEYIRSNIWNELLVGRYVTEKNLDKLIGQNQKLIYENILNVLHYLTATVHINRDGIGYMEFSDLQRYVTALDTINVYSTRIDDIFIFARIRVEVEYAQALLDAGRDEESLEMFSIAKEHFLALRALPMGSELKGSVPLFDKLSINISFIDVFKKCVMYIDGCYHRKRCERIRGEIRFKEFVRAVNEFSQTERGNSVIVVGGGKEDLDAKWEMLLSQAKKEDEKGSDHDQVIVLMTTSGEISVFKGSVSEDYEASALKAIIQLKATNRTKIERLICMWSEGGVDLPSYSFRKALLSLDADNASAKMLLQGLNGYIVKTVKATMPKGYKC